MEDTTVIQDTQPDEELDLDLETGEQETTPPAEDVEANKQRIAELEAKNKQLYARLKKQHKEPIKQVENIGDAGTRLTKLELAEAKRQFAWENGLSPEETDKVFAITQKPSKETLKDPFIKAGLEAIRAEKRVAEATPSPSGRGIKHNGKSFKEMTPEEREQFFADRAKR